MTRTHPNRQFLAGLAGLALSGLPVRRDTIGGREERLFRVVNGLPDGLYRPAWLIMQSGSLGAAPVTSAIAWAGGRPELARRLAVSGVATWALSKVVKRIYRRPRPAGLVAGTRCRGSAQSGLGFVSGHAGVAVALGAAAYPDLGPAARAAILLGVPTVGLCRIYTGAHLPLDVAGGAALGLAVDAVVARLAAGSETGPSALSRGGRGSSPG